MCSPEMHHETVAYDLLGYLFSVWRQELGLKYHLLRYLPTALSCDMVYYLWMSATLTAVTAGIVSVIFLSSVRGDSTVEGCTFVFNSSAAQTGLRS